jgi:hypothetical protein
MGIHPDCCTDRLRSPDVRRRAAGMLFPRFSEGAIDGRPPPAVPQIRPANLSKRGAVVRLGHDGGLNRPPRNEGELHAIHAADDSEWL